LLFTKFNDNFESRLLDNLKSIMSLQKKVLMSKLPPKPPGSISGILKARSGPRNRDYTPNHYSNYFTSKFEARITKEGKVIKRLSDIARHIYLVVLQGENVFCIYEVGSGRGPFIFMLHGGECECKLSISR